MTTTIITKNSSTASAVPLAADLVQGELAVNVTDKRLYTENASGTVVELGTTPSSVTTGAVACTTLSATGNVTLGDASTDTLNVGNGGLVKDASGNVGIGTSSPSNKLEVAGIIKVASDSNGYLDLGRFSSGYGGSVINGQNFLSFQTNGSDRARIDSSGNLLVGMTTTTSSPTYGGMYIVGDKNSGGTNYYAQMFMAHNSLTNHGFVIKELASGGGIAIAFRNSSMTAVGEISTSPTNTTYGTSSDYRLKENIAPMTGALSVVQQLKPCTYTWKIDGSNGQGFIAHELQEIVPDCVTGEKDAVEAYTDEEGNEQTRPRYQGIDTSFLVATLTAAIQEQQALIDAQTSVLISLTERITALEAK